MRDRRKSHGIRSGRPLAIADIAAPRDVDPAVAGIPGVRLTDLDTLKDTVEKTLALRQEQAKAADE